MTTLISLIRGINVSGHNIIKMETVRAIFSNLGMKNIQTYLQSGNVIFDYDDKDIIGLREQISESLSKQIGSKIENVILTIEQLQKIIDNNPFLNIFEFQEKQMYFTILASAPEINNFDEIVAKKIVEEHIAFGENVVYIYCPDGYGKTKLTNNLIESKLKVKSTTRNWNTLNEVMKISFNNVSLKNI